MTSQQPLSDCGALSLPARWWLEGEYSNWDLHDKDDGRGLLIPIVADCFS